MTGWGDFLVSYNGKNIAYDAIGNPLHWGNAITMNWNGRQLNYLLYHSSGLHGAGFSYNSDGIRTSKHYWNHSIMRDGNVVYTLDGSKIIREVRSGYLVPTETIDYYCDDSGVAGFEYNGTSYYYGKNLQGDIVRIYDSAGQIVVNYTYDAWGNILSITGSLASTIGNINPFRYRSYYYDTETGFYYLNSRYYDPAVGRFINSDEQLNDDENILGANLFSYCYNNPVNMSDSDGKIPTFITKMTDSGLQSKTFPKNTIKKHKTMYDLYEKRGYTVLSTAASKIVYVSQIKGNPGYVDKAWISPGPKEGCAISAISMALSSLGVFYDPKEVMRRGNGTVIAHWKKMGLSYLSNTTIDKALKNYLDNPEIYAPPIVKVTPTHYAIIISGQDGYYTAIDSASKTFYKNYKITHSYAEIIQYYKG